MAGYNLYTSQDLDPSHSCEELLADLAGRNWGLPDGARRAQLDVARQVLGNPVRRDMYDRQLGDATVTVSREDVGTAGVHGAPRRRSPIDGVGCGIG